MSRPIVNPGKVLWAGDHLLLYLRPAGAAEDTTRVSHYRTYYAGGGSGNVALVSIDLAGRGGRTELRAIYTDNPALTDWMRTSFFYPDNPLRDSSLEVRPGTFSSDGGIGAGNTHRVVIRGDGHEVVAVYDDFEVPFYFEAPAGGLRADRDVFSFLCPARTATVTLDGKAAAGVPYPRDTWTASTGQPRSSALIGASEVILQAPPR